MANLNHRDICVKETQFTEVLTESCCSIIITPLFHPDCAGDYIYWTDWQKRSIERIDKYTGLDHTIIIEQLPDLMGLKAVDVSGMEGQ